MTPAAPLVGAVTIRPPPAFSSETANANRFTHAASDDSSTVCPLTPARLSTSLLEASLAYILGARRGTSRPPGKTVFRVLHPRSTHSRITCQMLSSSARTCAEGRMDVSLAQTISEMLI